MPYLISLSASPIKVNRQSVCALICTLLATNIHQVVRASLVGIIFPKTLLFFLVDVIDRWQRLAVGQLDATILIRDCVERR